MLSIHHLVSTEYSTNKRKTKRGNLDLANANFQATDTIL